MPPSTVGSFSCRGRSLLAALRLHNLLRPCRVNKSRYCVQLGQRRNSVSKPNTWPHRQVFLLPLFKEKNPSFPSHNLSKETKKQQQQQTEKKEKKKKKPKQTRETTKKKYIQKNALRPTSVPEAPLHFLVSITPNQLPTQRRAMQITAAWGDEEVTVEVNAECRTLAALKALLQDALPELDVENVRLEVGGRELTDDDDVCGLEAGSVVEFSATAAALAAATLREEGSPVSSNGFFSAAQFGAVRLCGLYLDAGVTSTPRRSPLHIASQIGRVEIVRLLLDRGWDIYEKNHRGETSLYIASLHGRVEVVKLLLDRGCDIESKSRRGDTPLYTACFCNHVQVVALLLNRGCAIDAALLESAGFLDPMDNATRSMLSRAREERRRKSSSFCQEQGRQLEATRPGLRRRVDERAVCAAQQTG